MRNGGGEATQVAVRETCLEPREAGEGSAGFSLRASGWNTARLTPVQAAAPRTAREDTPVVLSHHARGHLSHRPLETSPGSNAKKLPSGKNKSKSSDLLCLLSAGCSLTAGLMVSLRDSGWDRKAETCSQHLIRSLASLRGGSGSRQSHERSLSDPGSSPAPHSVAV